MPSRAPHGVAGRDAAKVGPAGSVLAMLSKDQRELMVRLPAQVLIAATVGRAAVTESLAGLNAIAAGSELPSRLVRDVVGAIFAEADPVVAAAGGEDISSACVSAARALAASVPATESHAYCAWLQSIARHAGGGEAMCAAVAEAFRTP